MKSRSTSLLKWGELSFKVGRVLFQSGTSCLLKVAVVMGRICVGQVVFGESCPDSVV